MLSMTRGQGRRVGMSQLRTRRCMCVVMEINHHLASTLLVLFPHQPEPGDVPATN